MHTRNCPASRRTRLRGLRSGCAGTRSDPSCLMTEITKAAGSKDGSVLGSFSLRACHYIRSFHPEDDNRKHEVLISCNSGVAGPTWGKTKNQFCPPMATRGCAGAEDSWSDGLCDRYPLALGQRRSSKRDLWSIRGGAPETLDSSTVSGSTDLFFQILSEFK